MKRLIRALKGRFGVTAQQVAVRPELPWYWRLSLVFALLTLGYGVGYWRYADSDASELARVVERLQSENRALQEKTVRAERQLQVERAAQSNLAKEMAALQDEDMQLKEDVAFYKSILAEGGATGVLKLHGVKVTRGAREGEYQYRILLVQSGRHDKMVQGSLKLVLHATQQGKAVMQRVEPAGQQNGIKVNFKYYQRIEGSFNVPSTMIGQSLQVQFLEMGGTQPKLAQTLNLPA